MLELLLSGTIFLWIIFACSVLAVGITLERWQTMRQADGDSDALITDVEEAIEQGDLDGAIGICEEAGGPVAETLGVGLRKLRFLEGVGKTPEEIEKGIVAAMEEHGGHVVHFLERNLTALATVASMAPILGMLGTVVGMIMAFGSIHSSGNLSGEAVAGGISEALLCTAGGLIVAAIATCAFNYFTTRVSRFVLQIQAAGTEMLEALLQARASADRTA
ncbi:MAG: MotA/TolQ/ExbB proton channel family protein [Planctomycetes bacterium]|nr:MotA/TolQ/ExbB proton channel family protein [Planctomycetota bacterium]